MLWLAGGGVVYGGIGLVILVLARDRGASSAELGVMFAMTSAGGLLGALAAPRVLRSIAPSRIVVVFAWTAAGTALALVFAAIAADAPDRLQGRATSAAIQLGNLATPLGPLAAGLLLGALGATRTMVVYGALLTALAVVATASRALLRRELAEAPREGVAAGRKT